MNNKLSKKSIIFKIQYFIIKIQNKQIYLLQRLTLFFSSDRSPLLLVECLTLGALMFSLEFSSDISTKHDERGFRRREHLGNLKLDMFLVSGSSVCCSVTSAGRLNLRNVFIRRVRKPFSFDFGNGRTCCIDSDGPSPTGEWWFNSILAILCRLLELRCGTGGRLKLQQL